MLVGTVEEITILKVSGVYLLHDGRVSYIGESKDCIRRFLDHTTGRMTCGNRMILLLDTNRKSATTRRKLEYRFIAAAMNLGWSLVNSNIPSDTQIKNFGDLGYEERLLCEALGLFHNILSPPPTTVGSHLEEPSAALVV
jgi:hypothetical protein